MNSPARANVHRLLAELKTSTYVRFCKTCISGYHRGRFKTLIFLFRELLKDMPEYYVPEVIEDLTSKQVLTTELIKGTSLDKIENPDKDTINKVM